MKPVLERVIYPVQQSFRVYLQSLPYLQSPWHFHSDYELVLITKGYGKRFVGDHVESFSEGDLVWIGSNLPHVWINDQAFYSGNKELISESIVIQIDKEYFEKALSCLPEMKQLEKFLNTSRFGLKIKTRKDLICDIQRLLNHKGVSGFAYLLLLLDKISHSKTNQKLASQGFIEDFTPPANQRLGRVFEYLMKNYHHQITIDEVAKIAQMNPTSFCRFFKLSTGKTFFNYVNELRVGYASKLLIDGGFSISQICFESGFQSISNFNKQFKNVTEFSPSEFRQISTDKQ